MVTNQANPTEYNLDAGDIAWGGDTSYTFESAVADADLAGKAVTLDANGDIAVAADTDIHLGTVLDDTAHPSSLTTEKSDDFWTVHHGRTPVVVEMAGTPDLGVYVQPAAAGDGTYEAPATPIGPGSSLPLLVDEVDAANNLYVALMG